MAPSTLTELSQRDEAFWIGLTAFIGGVLLSDVGVAGAPGLSEALIAFGSLVITVRLFVGVYRIFRTTAVAGRVGYQEGKSN